MLAAASKRSGPWLGRHGPWLGRRRGAGPHRRLLATSPPETPTESSPNAEKPAPPPPPPPPSGGMDRTLMKHVGILTASQFAVNAGFGVIIPIMPALSVELGLSATAVGFLIASPSITRLLLNMPAGQWADTLGRKPLMVGGTLLTAAGGIATGFATSLATLLPMRLLVGVGSAASQAGASAYIADLTSKAPEHRAKILGVQQTVVAGAFIAGPALGGIIAEAYGPQQAFFFVGAAAALCSAGYSFLPETLTAAQAESAKAKRRASAAAAGSVGTMKALWAEWGGLISSPPQQAAIAVNAALYLGWSCEMCIVSLHAADTWNASPGELGMLFALVSAVGVAGAPLGGWLADRAATRQSVIVPSFCIATAGMASLAFADSYTTFLAGMTIFGVGTSMLGPAMAAYAVDVTPSDSRGRAFALHRQAQDLAWLAGPVGLGLVADLVGKPAAIMTGSGMIGTLTAFFLWRSMHPVSLKLAKAGRNNNQPAGPKA